MELFVSFAPDDTNKVADVVNLLEQSTHTIWYNYDAISGDDWQAQIVEQMKQSNAMIVIITPQLSHSDFSKWTITVAKHLRKPILPILMHETDVPETLANLPPIDFREGILDTNVVTLMQALHNIQSPTYMRQPATDPTLSTDEFRKVEGILKGSEYASLSSEYHEINSEIFKVLQPFVEDASTVYNPALSTQSELIETWQTIQHASMGFFNLSTIGTQGWIELGIAVALSKKLILVAMHSEPLPRVLEQYRILRYTNIAELEPEFVKLREMRFFESTEAENPCYLCSKTGCQAVSRHEDNQSYKVITDSRMLWQGMLGAFKTTVQEKAMANPAFSSDRSPNVCDLRASIVESKFILTHLDYIQNPMNLIYLGLAIGHTKPWFMIYRKVKNLPTLLESLARMEDQGIEAYKKYQTPIVEQFLDSVYGTETSSNKKPDTSPAFDWQALRNSADGQFGHRHDSHEMIQGEINIVRIYGNGLQQRLHLHPRQQLLTFGRASGPATVELKTKFASGSHFQIYKRNNRYFVEDLGSRNGTYLNGKLLRRNTATEIYFEDNVMAAGAHFLIWDERPLTHEPQPIGLTQEKGSGIAKIRLNVLPPAGLELLNQEITLNAMYHTPNGTMKKVAFEIQAYYPLNYVLDALVDGLALPENTYNFYYQNERVNLSKSPTQLHMKAGDILEITVETDKSQVALSTLVDAIDHCEHDLMVEQGELVFKTGYQYRRFSEMYQTVYKNLYKIDLDGMDSRLLDGTRCKRCNTQFRLNTQVAFKRA